MGASWNYHKILLRFFSENPRPGLKTVGVAAAAADDDDNDDGEDATAR